MSHSDQRNKLITIKGGPGSTVSQLLHRPPVTSSQCFGATLDELDLNRWHRAMSSMSTMGSTYGNDADRMTPQGAVANAQDSGIFSAVCSGDRDRSRTSHGTGPARSKLPPQTLLPSRVCCPGAQARQAANASASASAILLSCRDSSKEPLNEDHRREL